MQTLTVKQEALAAIESLPDNTDMEEIMYRLYVIENIQRGQQDALQGKVHSIDEVLKSISTW